MGALVVSLTLAELGLRWREPDVWRVWPAHLERTFLPDPALVPGVSGPSRFSTNAWGMRGDAWNEAARHHVLAVGGSTTICIYLDDSEAWPHLVQEILNASAGPDHTWVGNVGRPGHTTHQNLLQLEKLLAQHPGIDTVLMMVGANDLLVQLALQLPRSANAAAEPFDLAPDPDAELARAFSDVPPRAEAPWYRRSALVRALASRRWRVDGAGALPLLDETGRFFAEARAYRRQASQLLDTLPNLTGAQRQFVRNLARSVDLAEAAGVRLILVTQPTLWDPGLSERERDLLWTGGPPANRLAPGEAYYSVAALAEGMRAYNALLLEVCRRRRLDCVDAASRLPRSSQIFYDDLHLTEEGSRRLADLIAGLLLETGERRGSGEEPRAR